MPLPSEEPTAPSAEAAKWLGIVEDQTKDIQDRIKAVYEPEQLKEPATAERLIKLLPGNYDAFTFRIVVALEQIESPQALPLLKKMYNEENIDIPGKIRVALEGAIRACGGDPNDPK